MIRIDDYPQLRQLAWNRPGMREIAEPEALALYEANWRFVDVDAMTVEERRLLHRLRDDYGRGVLNVRP